MKSQRPWRLLVLLLLVCGKIGCGGAEPEPPVCPQDPVPPKEATVATARAEVRGKGNGYGSPQEAGEAFITAMSKKDWKTGFRCFSPEARDLAVAHLIIMTRYVAVLAEKEEEVEALFEKHGFQYANAKETAEAMLRSEKAKQGETDYKNVVRTFVDQIEDKELLFASTLTWLDENFGGRDGVGACALQDLKLTDDTATGKLKLTGPENTAVRFRKADGRWFMALSEEEYRPSGWNDVFLMGFLDAMYGWSM